MASRIDRSHVCNFIPPYVLDSFRYLSEQKLIEDQKTEAPFITPEKENFLLRCKGIRKVFKENGSYEVPEVASWKSLSFCKLEAPGGSCTVWSMQPDGNCVKVLSDVSREDKTDKVAEAQLNLLGSLVPSDPPKSIRNCFKIIQSVQGVFRKYELLNSHVGIFVSFPELLTAQYEGETGSINIGFSETELILTEYLTSNADFLAHHLGHHAIREIGKKRGFEEIKFLRGNSESNALSEHLSDVFAIVAKHKLQPQGEDVDWNIGTGMFRGQPGQRGFHLRSMKAPGTAHEGHCFIRKPLDSLPKELAIENADPAIVQLRQKLLDGDDPQPNSMKYYAKIEYDRGGEHIFSGPLNRAFCLFANFVKKPSFDTPFEVWLATLQNIEGNAGFKEFAQQALEAASLIARKHGYSEIMYKIAIRRAWSAVGIDLDPIMDSSHVAALATERIRIAGLPEGWGEPVQELYHGSITDKEEIVLYRDRTGFQAVIFFAENTVQLNGEQILFQADRWLFFFQGDMKPIGLWSREQQTSIIQNLKSGAFHIQLQILPESETISNVIICSKA